ncbi:hypothetical protein RRG08_027180, partial [Elysia crispata]
IRQKFSDGKLASYPNAITVTPLTAQHHHAVNLCLRFVRNSPLLVEVVGQCSNLSTAPPPDRYCDDIPPKFYLFLTSGEA